jgi:hypothetical protein
MAQTINIDDFEVGDKVIVPILGKNLYRIFLKEGETFPIFDWVNKDGYIDEGNPDKLKATYQLYARIINIDKIRETVTVIAKYPKENQAPQNMAWTSKDSRAFIVRASQVKWTKEEAAKKQKERDKYEARRKLALAAVERAKRREAEAKQQEEEVERKEEEKKKRAEKKKKRQELLEKFRKKPRRSERNKLHEEYTEKLKL